MEEPKKKRKLLIVDLAEPKIHHGQVAHDTIIKESQRMAASKGTVNYGDEVWDLMTELYKTEDEATVQKLAERCRLMMAAARSAKAAGKLAKLGEYLQDKGVNDQNPELIEKGDKLVEKAKEMKDAPTTAATARPVQQKKAAKQPKKPVFQDPEQQKAVKLKYDWAIEGSFRQDPEKAGGTILDIKCQKCGESRTIHLADCFQVKLCLKCRGTK